MTPTVAQVNFQLRVTVVQSLHFRIRIGESKMAEVADLFQVIGFIQK
jgi:hypothetical protein